MSTIATTNSISPTDRPTAGRTLRPLAHAAAGLTLVALAWVIPTPASASQDSGFETGRTAVSHAAPVTVARIGTQIVRCDTGEGNLGGAGATAPLTLPVVSSCAPTNVDTVAPASVRRLEHDPLR